MERRGALGADAFVSAGTQASSCRAQCSRTEPRGIGRSSLAPGFSTSRATRSRRRASRPAYAAPGPPLGRGCVESTSASRLSARLHGQDPIHRHQAAAPMIDDLEHLSDLTSMSTLRIVDGIERHPSQAAAALDANVTSTFNRRSNLQILRHTHAWRRESWRTSFSSPGSGAVSARDCRTRRPARSPRRSRSPSDERRNGDRPRCRSSGRATSPASTRA